MHASDIFWVDISVAAIVIVSTVLAVLRGFVREVLSILAWFAAAAAALWIGPRASEFLRLHISTPFAAPVLAYAGIFLLVLLPLAFGNSWLAHHVRRSPVGMVDRCLGAPFGIVRGLAVAGLAYLAISLVIPYRSQPAWLTHAKCRPMLQASSDVISWMLPDFGRPAAEPGSSAGRPRLTPAPRPARTSYQSADRRALDRLIANTSASENGRP